MQKLIHIYRVNYIKQSIDGALKKPVTWGTWMLVLGEVIALGIVVAAATSWFGTTDAISIVLAMMIAYLIPRFIYSRTRPCQWGQWWLLVLATALAIYVILSIKACTIDVGNTLEMPQLKSDDGSYYRWALANYDGRCDEPYILFKGLPIIMLGMWKVLGVSIVWPIALNYMFTLLTIVVTGMIARRLLTPRFDNVKPATIAAVAMIMVSLMGFFLSQGVRIQKEAACSLGMALVGYSFVGFSINTHDKREQRNDIIAFVLGLLLVALVRSHFGYFIVIGALMMSLAHKRSQWKRGVIMAVIALLFTVLFNYLFSYTIEHQYLIIDGGDTMAHDFKAGFTQQPYFSLIGDYYYYPEWVRLLLLPVTGAVQYVIPFPWLYDLSDVTPFELLPRMRFMWYFVGGVCLHYYLYISVVRYKQTNLGMWAWWPLMVFFIIAFITAGSVSRYILPLQPLFVVIALYVILCVHEGHYRRSFLLWMIVYTLILVALLILCYHTQVEYIDSLDEYYRLKAKHLI